MWGHRLMVEIRGSYYDKWYRASAQQPYDFLPSFVMPKSMASSCCDPASAIVPSEAGLAGLLRHIRWRPVEVPLRSESDAHATAYQRHRL